MNSLAPYYLIFVLWLMVGHTTGFCQRKDPAPMGALVMSNMFSTTDSIHYLIKYNQASADGRYTIYDVVSSNNVSDPTNDTSSPPLYVIQDRHSRGTFRKGVKIGLWEYYVGERKVQEVIYQQGRRVSQRKCPCKK